MNDLISFSDLLLALLNNLILKGSDTGYINSDTMKHVNKPINPKIPTGLSILSKLAPAALMAINSAWLESFWKARKQASKTQIGSVFKMILGISSSII